MKRNSLRFIRGEILREEFMLPRGLSQNALARALKVPPRRINEIANELEIMRSGAIIAKRPVPVMGKSPNGKSRFESLQPSFSR